MQWYRSRCKLASIRDKISTKDHCARRQASRRVDQYVQQISANRRSPRLDGKKVSSLTHASRMQHVFSLDDCRNAKRQVPPFSICATTRGSGYDLCTALAVDDLRPSSAVYEL